MKSALAAPIIAFFSVIHTDQHDVHDVIQQTEIRICGQRIIRINRRSGFFRPLGTIRRLCGCRFGCHLLRQFLKLTHRVRPYRISIRAKADYHSQNRRHDRHHHLFFVAPRLSWLLRTIVRFFLPWPNKALLGCGFISYTVRNHIRLIRHSQDVGCVCLLTINVFIIRIQVTRSLLTLFAAPRPYGFLLRRRYFNCIGCFYSRFGLLLLSRFIIRIQIARSRLTFFAAPRSFGFLLRRLGFNCFICY